MKLTSLLSPRGNYNKRCVDMTRSGFYVTVFYLTNIFK